MRPLKVKLCLFTFYFYELFGIKLVLELSTIASVHAMQHPRIAKQRVTSRATRAVNSSKTILRSKPVMRPKLFANFPHAETLVRNFWTKHCWNARRRPMLVTRHWRTKPRVSIWPSALRMRTWTVRWKGQNWRSSAQMLLRPVIKVALCPHLCSG